MAAPTSIGGRFDLLVVGSGAAGLSAALAAAPRGSVAVVSKGSLADGCSRWAQGGIAVALGDDDSAQHHFEDTLAAGRGLCDPAAVRVLVEEGPARVRELVDMGVPFDRDGDGSIALAREAAHSRARVVHAGGDATGMAVETTLIARVRAERIAVVEHCEVTSLLLDAAGRCCGVLGLDESGAPLVLRAAAVVLATGGASRLWRDSTNPGGTTGDGIALAHEARADIMGMEFEQFHPTALAVSGAPRRLISEAVRGEGAVVVDRHGRRFLFDHDRRGELAGRDVVSRAIWEHLQGSGDEHVLLDCSPIGDRVVQRFPAMTRVCADAGLDPRHDRIPIAPAAHYTIGGVRTDLRGATTVAGLYACGEVAASGVHGANRLASNSLLEALVFGRRAALAALADTGELPPAEPEMPARPPAGDDPSSVEASAQAALASAMWRHAGVVRDATGLATALAVCDEVADSAGATQAAARLRRAALTASLVCRSGLRRQETRGAHVRSDYQDTAPEWHGVNVVMRRERRAHSGDHA